MAIQAHVSLLVRLCRYCLLVPRGWPQVVRHAPRPGAAEVRGEGTPRGSQLLEDSSQFCAAWHVIDTHVLCMCCMPSGPLLLRHVPLLHLML
jgi:hypothetical protein